MNEDETKVDEAEVAAEPAKEGDNAELGEEEKAAGNALFKYVMAKLDNEIDTASEKAKDARKGKLYTGSYTADDIKALDKEARAAKFIRAIANGDRQMAAQLQGKLQNLNEGTGARGGFLVPEEWAADIVTQVEEESFFRQLATVVNTTRDTFHVPRVDTSAQAYWRSEGAVKQTTTITFAENVLTPYSLASIIVATEEMIADSDYNVTQIIGREMARRFADAETQAFLMGSGTGQPTGLNGYTPRATQNAGGALSGDHIVNAYYELPMALRNRAVWIMHPRNHSLLRTLKDSQNRYLFELNGNIGSAQPATLLGRPVYETGFADQDRIYLVDLSYYWIAQRQGFTLDTSRDATVAGTSMFETNQVAFRAEERVDGELAWTGAYVLVDDVRTGD